MPVPSIEDPEGATFVVHPRHEHEEPIVFHRSEELPPTSPVANPGTLQFYRYSEKAQHMKQRMGYDVNNPAPLNEGEGILAPLQPELSEDQKEDIQTFNEMKQRTHGMQIRQRVCLGTKGNNQGMSSMGWY